MKKASRVIKDQALSEKDFKASLKDAKIKKFVDMLSNNLYGFRVKQMLYSEGKISVKGLLYNDNIYNLPLGKRNDAGEILIDNSLLPIFDRYLLAEELTLKGDALTAFMVDHDDSLYQVMKANTTAVDKMSEQEYIQIFSRAYNTTSDIILEYKINKMLADTPEMMSVLEEEDSTRATMEVVKIPVVNNGGNKTLLN